MVKRVLFVAILAGVINVNMSQNAQAMSWKRTQVACCAALAVVTMSCAISSVTSDEESMEQDTQRQVVTKAVQGAETGISRDCKHGQNKPAWFETLCAWVESNVDLNLDFIPGLPHGTILHYAAAYGDLDLATKVLDKNGDAKVDILSLKGKTPLCFAVATLNPRMVELLLRRGANPQLLPALDRETFFMGEVGFEEYAKFSEIERLLYCYNPNRRPFSYFEPSTWFKCCK